MQEKSNLKNTAVKGLFWSGLERFGSQGIQLIIGIIVTRILQPEDYGLLGMIMIFVAVGQALVDSGFGSALIIKKDPTQGDYSTVFYFNMGVSILLYAILYFTTPFIADFYDKPQLILLIRVIGIAIIFNSLSLIHQVILQKKFNFKILATTNILGTVVAGLISIFLALKGFGVWALIAQYFIKSLITTVSMWIFCKWAPNLVFNLKTLKQMFNYGIRLTTANLVYTIFSNIYANIIGKLFPVNLLGFYTRAVQLQEFPVKTVTGTFQRIAFPVFSMMNDNFERQKNAVRKTIRTLAFITYPLIFGLIAVSDEMFLVLFTEKWLPASVYFKLLCLIGIFYFILTIFGEIIKAHGRSGWILLIELVTKSILIINIVITFRWGIETIILGQLVSVFSGYILVTYFVGRLIGYTFSEQIADIKYYFLLSLAMYIICMFIGKFSLNPLPMLIIKTAFGIVFYSVTTSMLKLTESREVFQAIGKVTGKIKGKISALSLGKNI